MIHINLLPQTLRKKQRMPIQFLLGIIGGVLAFCLLGYIVAGYELEIIPGLKRERDNLTQTRNRLRLQAEELRQINAEIARLTEYVDAVKTLYRNRVVWSKILSDMKNIIDFDPVMNEYNAEMRYLWFNKLTGKGKAITLTGFATALEQRGAMQLYEQLLQSMRIFAPLGVPERGEEIRLQNELKVTMAEYEELRRVNPELPPQGPNEIAILERLEEIKGFKSGGIALQPFSQFLVPGSLRLNNATWATSPKPRGLAKDLEALFFPDNAWNFSISMELK
ncbi:MAG: hypothetical protein FWG74_03835 [Planctomycetes bacterium]|nr:hypothetical protein [Planctomycetota bacterium]